MQVIVTEPIHHEALSLLQQYAEVITWDNPQSRDWSKADAIIVRANTISREQMLSAPNLKVIGKHGIGVNAIDIQAARELGIQVVYTPHSNVNSVAELIVSMMLCVSRKLIENHQMIQKGAKRISPPELTGLELSHKALGLIGLGRISQRLAQITSAGFNMTIHGFDPFVDESVFQRLGIIRHTTLASLLAQSDFISVSVPLTKNTENLISDNEFNHFRPNAVLINTSRGGVVNEQALYTALKEKKIFGAASDVFISEPPKAEHPLFTLPNFIGSLHVGACTEEALLRVGNTVVNDVIAVLQGEKPHYPYNGN